MLGAGLQLSAAIRWWRRYVESARNTTDCDSWLGDVGLLLPGERFDGDAWLWPSKRGCHVSENVLAEVKSQPRQNEFENAFIFGIPKPPQIGAIALAQRVNRWLASCGVDRGGRAGQLEQRSARRTRDLSVFLFFVGPWKS